MQQDRPSAINFVKELNTQLGYDVTIHLGYDDVVKILSEYLKQTKGLVVENTHFNVVKQQCGMPPNTYECLNFKGVTFKGNYLTSPPQSKIDYSILGDE